MSNPSLSQSMQHGHSSSHDHAGHGVDMSQMRHADHEAAVNDPCMAKEMERDMRRRFWVAFILSVPIFLYSPVGISLFGVLPSPMASGWLLFALTTPVVFWAGSIFITGTYHALRKHTLNMSVLIVTGVLAAYGFSVFLVFTDAGETFFEAAALLMSASSIIVATNAIMLKRVELKLSQKT